MSKLEDLREDFETQISRRTEPGWQWTAEERRLLAERLDNVFNEIVKVAGDIAVEEYQRTLKEEVKPGVFVQKEESTSVLQGKVKRQRKKGTPCPECGEPQYKCPSGTVCKNGHGY